MKIMLQPRKCFKNNVLSYKNNEEISSDYKSGDSVSGSNTEMVGFKQSGSGSPTWWNLTRKSVLIYVICIAVLAKIQPTFCQEYDVEGSEGIEVTRLRRDVGGGERDLTTVLLLGNQNKAGDFNKKAGRYHSVKPVIGLLTSTARTFIQDGVTTEYATQILGTTLDNGRIYAQVLTKSSLVLYNKPSDIDDPYVVKATKLPNLDGSWDVKQDLGFINPDKFVLKNTDYISPHSDKMFTVYASKPVKHDYTKLWNAEVEPDITSRFGDPENPEEIPVRIQELKDIPRYSENDDLNLLDAPISDNERRIKTYINTIVSENKDGDAGIRNDKSLSFPAGIKEQASNTQEVTIEKEPLPIEINPEKVKPDANLPTFTVKNEFSPVFYYIDNVESKKSLQSVNQVDNSNRNPKKIFAQKSESRPKTTFTYEGFADFTTMVGDTVIIFTPNTAKVSPGQQGERLEQYEPSAISGFDKESVSQVKQVIPTNAPMLPHPTFVRPEDPVRSSKALKNDENSLNNVLYENPISNEEQSLDSITESMLDGAISLQGGSRLNHDHNFGLNVEVIQPSEVSYTTLNRVHATQQLNEDQLESVLLDSAIDPIVLTPTIKETLNSETVFEVTPEMAVEEFTEPMILETEGTTETSAETTTQTSPVVKDEEEEEIQSRPEGVRGSDIEESHIETNPEDATCTDGIIPVSTMTTAYKTLTYLTTFFIPLEGTETTTSIKSHEVLDRDVGFITNFECKTKMIQPSKVVPDVIQTMIQSSTGEELSDNSFIETSTETTVKSLTTTERQEELIEKQEDTPTSTVRTTHKKTTEIEEEYTQQTEKEEEQHTTTEHSVTTSESHVAITVTTEKEVDITTNKILHEAEESDLNDTSEVNNKENEIDLIYKTLYTTYRYFTTFFQGSTSSIATHKSVITNVITSTVDWSNIDPSIMKAFDTDYEGGNKEYDIAPTSVGIGRPTESLVINSLIDLVQHRDVIESVRNDQVYISQMPTPELAGGYIDGIKPDAVKTYYTTYTFFTTIYVGDDANICSRSEIYTNYVGPKSLVPTATNTLGDMATKKTEFDFRNCKQVSGLKKGQEVEEDTKMSVSEEETGLEVDGYHSYSSIIRTPAIEQPTEPSPVEVDMLFSVAPDMEDGRFVTDVKSSSSKGEKMIIDNGVLDDQISSESNIDEIMPSPTLLLQTSYTTFTYFTTMYIGKDSSKIKSRLETITNVVTETLSPLRQDQIEEANLPITYYTTFTYWTTLYKDKTTTITSREEIISNIVKPSVLAGPIDLSPIDTTPIEVDTIQHKDLDIKPSVIIDELNQDDEKATFYTTYTYFTTFYVGNTSQIRSSLETVTNIVDNTKDPINDNQIGRAVGNGAAKNNLVNEDVKPHIVPTVLKEIIKPTKLEQLPISPTSLIGTYIDNLYAEVQPINPPFMEKPDTEPRIISSQVAIISGDSTIITNQNNSIKNESNLDLGSITTSTLISSPTPDMIESSVTDPTTFGDTEEQDQDQDEDEDLEEGDGGNTKKRTRLAYQTPPRTFTPVIRPFSSRNRPTFSPKRVSLVGGATTITRSDFTPTITATPALKSVKSSGFAVKKQPSSSIINGSSRRFGGGRGSSVIGSASGSRSAGFGRSKSVSSEIQPSSRRTGFRSSSLGLNVNTPNRGASSRIGPSVSSRVRGKTLSSSARYQDYASTIIFDEEENNEQTSTQEVDETSEPAVRKTNNPTLKFRRPGARTPGSGPAQRTTPIPSARKSSSTRGRVTSTTPRPTTRTTPNPLFALRNRNRPNALFPPRGFLKHPEPQVEKEKNDEKEVDQEEEEQIADDEDFDDDSEYESSDKKEEQVATTQPPRRNSPLIKPFVGFRRRSKRQVDYGTRKYSNFRRPGIRTTPSYKRDDVELEPETEAPTTPRTRGRFTARSSFANRAASAPVTTTSSPKTSRQPFIIRGESRTTPSSTSGSSFRSRGRPSTRTPKSSSSSRPSAPRLKTNSFKNNYMEPARTSSRNSARTSGTSSRTRGRSNSRFRTTNDNNENQINQIQNDGKITVTHHIPSEVTISVVNGKVTEYKNLITAKPSLEVLQPNQYSTSIGPFGNPQLVIASESTDLSENGATRIIKYVLQESPTTTVVFTPTTIRGRRTSYSHIIPSTVYNVEAVTSTLAPEINPNVPLANILLSQLLLGNVQQQPINPLLALQGQPQLQGPATPVTEFKTRTTSYVTTVIDEKSTVIPLTFRGKEILTTIVDSKTNVITATEFITDTFVTTPTVFPQQNPNQINSLLLLLQQQQQQQALLQTANPLLGLSPDLSQTTNNNLIAGNDLYQNSPKPEVSDVDHNYDDVYVDESVEEETVVTEPPRKPFRKNRPKANKPAPRQSSVVTLYVSGRTPGEFSTVLSTVYDDSNVRKREAIYFENVNIRSTDLPRFDEIYSSQSDVLLDNLLAPKEMENQTSENQIETQSLESIVGEVSKYISLGSSNRVLEYNSPPTEVLRMIESDNSLDHYAKA